MRLSFVAATVAASLAVASAFSPAAPSLSLSTSSRLSLAAPCAFAKLPVLRRAQAVSTLRMQQPRECVPSLPLHSSSCMRDPAWFRHQAPPRLVSLQDSRWWARHGLWGEGVCVCVGCEDEAAGPCWCHALHRPEFVTFREVRPPRHVAEQLGS